ncbi:uncharacterized protein [Porites lutea]|uniref:uncharacterized protein n=1 Tax=Porites lutea TaxID=51062 RepID=UPI003CC517D3
MGIALGLLWLTHFISCGWCSIPTGEQRWSASFLSQASELSCEPGKVRRNATFLHGTKSGNFTKLGKVSDLEVCTLLCCELDRCQAAFLAGTNCYAVTCFTKNHCATVPALNNKWQPMVAFVKRFNKVAHVEAASNDESQNDQDAALHAGKTYTESKEESESHSTSTGAKSKEDMRLKMFSKEHKLKAASNSGVAHAQRHSAKYNLVSAAVATCLMAFILSGCAVVAAKIRKQKESTTDYAPVPDTQE